MLLPYFAGSIYLLSACMVGGVFMFYFQNTSRIKMCFKSES